MYRRLIMALWKDESARDTGGRLEPAAKAPEKVAVLNPVGEPAARPVAPVRSDAALKESVIAAGLTIEGKIEGAGHVRIAGDFKGDVNVQGNLTIEAGAHLTGGVKADTVI